MALGRNVVAEETAVVQKVTRVNTRHALWPERWPAIALQECIDMVEASLQRP